MNLSPRRISASLRGRNRHITLMLHSAGSAISVRGAPSRAGDGPAARGWARRRNSAFPPFVRARLAGEGERVRSEAAAAASRRHPQRPARLGQQPRGGSLRPQQHLRGGGNASPTPQGSQPALLRESGQVQNVRAQESAEWQQRLCPLSQAVKPLSGGAGAAAATILPPPPPSHLLWRALALFRSPSPHPMGFVTSPHYINPSQISLSGGWVGGRYCRILGTVVLNATGG